MGHVHSRHGLAHQRAEHFCLNKKGTLEAKPPEPGNLFVLPENVIFASAYA